MCHHVCASGCACYESRPVECADFSCAWLAGFGGPKFRPDLVGFVTLFSVFHTQEDGGSIAALSLWEYRAGALRSQVAVWLTLNNLHAGNCVMHVPDPGEPIFYLGKGRASVGVMVVGQNDEDVRSLSYEDALRSLARGPVS
jgi:hypothetical protein